MLGGAILSMLSILIPYGLCLKNKLTPLAFTVLTGLFVNELFASVCRLLPYLWCYLDWSGDAVVCSITLALTTFFQISAGMSYSKRRSVDLLYLENGL